MATESLTELQNKPSQTRFIHLDCVDSTNTFLRQYHPQADETMTVTWADFQTAGRGQGKNHWESESGKNLTFSILAHPTNVKASEQYLLSMAGALAVKQSLDPYTSGISIKWPNDVYWHDLKISGTLIETTLSGASIRSFIFGIGINVNQTHFTSDAPNPVSLCQILGHEVEREPLLWSVAKRLQTMLDSIAEGKADSIRAAYRASLYRREGLHRYVDKDGPFMASIAEVADDGHIVLRREDGRLQAYAFKEVAFVVPSKQTDKLSFK